MNTEIINEQILINDRYKLIKIIGKGSSANVYLAEDVLDNNKIVALKIQNKIEEFSNMDKRFKIEGSTLLNLNHPNIVKTYDYFKWNGRRIIVMEYLRGKTLEQLIKEKNVLSNSEVIDYSLQILVALDEIHSKDIMHRDLKPANIIINLDNRVILMDFGIIQVSKNQELTRQASVIGTIQYLAPERFKGEKATPTSELFALGVLMYKMLTGVVPFKGSNIEETAKKIIYNEPLRPSRINPDVDSKLEIITMRLLEKDPYNRFKDAKQVIDFFNKFLNFDDKNSDDSVQKNSKNKKRKFFWT